MVSLIVVLALGDVVIGESTAREIHWALEKEFPGLAPAGIGSQTSDLILERYERDTYGHEIVFLLMGHNDVFKSVPPETTLDRFEQIFDLAELNEQTLLASLISPRTQRGTREVMERWEAVNVGLPNLAASFPNVYVVDPLEALGQERPSGPPGNLWDIKTPYDRDGVHLTTLGYQVWASEIKQTWSAIPEPRSWLMIGVALCLVKLANLKFKKSA